MKILLSAFSCRPGVGSEPGVGWAWAVEVARRGHEVCVITRSPNKSSIEKEQALFAELEGIRFVYYDLPKRFTWWHKGLKGIRIYYYLWQWGAYRRARKLLHTSDFDLVHHITFVTLRLPAFVCRLGIPFVFGPVAGGETAPYPLRFGYGLYGWLFDLLRDCSNFLVKFDPVMRQVFSRSSLIFVTSNQTRALLPRSATLKASVQLAIGCDPSTIKVRSARVKRQRHVSNSSEKQRAFNVLYVGQLLHWKGMHLGLEAFAEFAQNYSLRARLQIVGAGRALGLWRRCASSHEINDLVDWTGRVPRHELASIYDNNDVFIYPSLRDSGAMVVLEALARGLPVVCLDLGGPGQIVDETCGRVISTYRRSRKAVVAAMTSALAELARDEEERLSLSRGAIEKASQYTWSRTVDRVYEKVEKLCL